MPCYSADEVPVKGNADNGGGRDGPDQPHAAATARTGKDVEVDRAPHQVGPGLVARFAGSLVIELGGGAGRGGSGAGVPSSSRATR